MSEHIIREVSKNVWIFSRPFTQLGFLKFGGRSTAIKLNNGDVWMLVSTPLTEETKDKLKELGPVKYLIGANGVHSLFLREFREYYTDAKLIVVAPLADKKKKETQGLKFDGVIGVDEAGTKYGFEDEISYRYFSGFQLHDAGFFHHASKSLITTDLIINLPANEQYSKTKTSPRIPFISSSFNPSGGLHKWLMWFWGADKDTMRKDINAVASWDFERIIMSHGDIIEENAKGAWNEAYSRYKTP